MGDLVWLGVREVACNALPRKPGPKERAVGDPSAPSVARGVPRHGDSPGTKDYLSPPPS